MNTDSAADRALADLDAYLALLARVRTDAFRLRRRIADLAVARARLKATLEVSMSPTWSEVARRVHEATGVDVGDELEPERLTDLIHLLTASFRDAADGHQAALDHLEGVGTVADACERLLRRIGQASARELTTLLQLAGLATTRAGYQTVARALARDRRFAVAGRGRWQLDRSAWTPPRRPLMTSDPRHR